MSSPVVTGISPKEGPPGTRVTIRGENLGKNPQDLIGLTICGIDCLLSAEWQAPNKIIARSGPAKGRGDIIVTTKSGGCGTCTIQFRSSIESIGPLKECAVWYDESHLVGFHGRKRVAVQAQFQQDNPLGLSDEGNVKKFPEEELHDTFPEGSGSLSSENFVPIWFLVENHNNASFRDLQAGLSCLKRKVSTQKEGELSFLKANISAVLDQLETLSTLQEKIAKDKETVGSISTDIIEQAITLSKNEADNLFKDVLGRRERADATRNALGVLQRFKFLFHLPCNIERNIQKGDYDIVINDYARAKSLFADTEVPLFRKVYQEVEQRIANFQEFLKSRLQDLPMPLDTQKRLIRYLVNLETPGDPGWECIRFQQEYFLKVLQDCENVYSEKDAAMCELSAVGLVQSKNSSTSKPSTLTSLGITRLGRGDRRGSNYSRNDIWQERPPNRILFAEELCTLTVQELSNFWKLGQSYFSGELLTKETGSSSQPLQAGKLSQFDDMIKLVMHSFCRCIRCALLDEKTSSPHSQWPEATRETAMLWLPQCIQHIKNFYSAVRELDLPNNVIVLTKKLLFDMRVTCLRSMFTRSAEEVRNLHTKETWIVEMDLEHGGITQLPLVYENTILKTIQLARESVLKVGPKEIELLTNPTTEGELVNLWRELLLGFPIALKDLAKTLLNTQTSTSSKGDGKLVSRVVADAERALENVMEEYSREKLLLVILGNCNFTRLHVLPRLFDSFGKYGFPKADNVTEEALKSFEELDNYFFNTYMELKSDPIIGVLEQQMYSGHFDWATCPRIMGVRPYIKQILLDVITVYCEVHSVSPSIVSRAMKSLVESACEEISRLFSCIERYSIPGNYQARVDIMALRLVFNDYLSESSKQSINDVLDALPLVHNAKNNKVLEDELNMFQQRMRFQLMCFKTKEAVGVQ